MNDCCEDIKNAINDLSNLNKHLFERTRKIIQNAKKHIRKLLDFKEKRVYDFYNNEKEAFKTEYQSKQTELKQIFDELQDHLDDKLDDILTIETIDENIENLQNDVTSMKITLGNVERKVNAIESSVNNLTSIIDGIVVSIAEVGATLGGIVVDIEFSQKAILATITGLFVEITGLVLKKLFFDSFTLKREINNGATNVKNDVDVKIKHLKGNLDNKFKDLNSQVGEETSYWIVGEAYQRWDSITSY